jgi:hypothetical protein
MHYNARVMISHGSLTAVLFLAGLLAAGCAGMEMGGGARVTEQELCEQGRGGGVWVQSAGACIRGGGGG